MEQQTSVFQSVADLRKRRHAEKTLSDHMGHIRKHNPRINAIVTVDEETALQRARALDQEQPQAAQALRGVPVQSKTPGKYRACVLRRVILL